MFFVQAPEDPEQPPSAFSKTENSGPWDGGFVPFFPACAMHLSICEQAQTSADRRKGIKIQIIQ